jgi:hypothetical protein
LVVAALMCLVLVAVMALAVAPAALAKASTLSFSGTETWAVFPPADPVAWNVTGGVVNGEFFNFFTDSAITPASAAYMIAGANATHLFVVAKLVDGVPGDANIRGTFHKDCVAGEWEGTFTGTMSMQTLAWDIKVQGKGVSGEVTGMIMLGRSVTDESGTFATVSGTILAPHGF